MGASSPGCSSSVLSCFLKQGVRSLPGSLGTNRAGTNSCSASSHTVSALFTAEGRYNLYTADGKYIFKERESFDGRNILKVSMMSSGMEVFWHMSRMRRKQGVVFSHWCAFFCFS